LRKNENTAAILSRRTKSLEGEHYFTAFVRRRPSPFTPLGALKSLLVLYS
jgi:hypothetical protein